MNEWKPIETVPIARTNDDHFLIRYVENGAWAYEVIWRETEDSVSVRARGFSRPLWYLIEKEAEWKTV